MAPRFLAGVAVEALPRSRQELARNGPPGGTRKRKVLHETAIQLERARRESTAATSTAAETEGGRTEGEGESSDETEDDDGLDSDDEHEFGNRQGSKRVAQMLDIGSLTSDSSHVARQGKHDLATHLHYSETVRRGLLHPETEDEQTIADAMRPWTHWPLLPTELPEAYHEWTLADDALALVDRFAGPTQDDEDTRLEVDELVPSIPLFVQAAVEGVLRQLVKGRPSAKTQAKASQPEQPRVDWRRLLVAAEEAGLPPRVVYRTHARLSALYRPQDVDEHILPRRVVYPGEGMSIEHGGYFEPVSGVRDASIGKRTVLPQPKDANERRKAKRTKTA